ncbi:MULTISPECIES: hypothetical protein [unclassified Microcoleus]|uniref:hypothetical protein n=1 Tax=unclassified Microcoleus TaxID=2642155 RepID=UPI002FD6FD30
MLSLGPLAITPNWRRLLLAIGDRLSLEKLSKVCCSIEYRTYADRTGFYPTSEARQPAHLKRKWVSRR